MQTRKNLVESHNHYFSRGFTAPSHDITTSNGLFCCRKQKGPYYCIFVAKYLALRDKNIYKNHMNVFKSVCMKTTAGKKPHMPFNSYKS